MKRIATKWMVTLLFVMIIGLGLLGFSIHHVITQHYRSYIEQSLYNRTESYANILSHDFETKTLQHVAGMEKGPSTGVAVFSPTGNLLIHSGLVINNEVLQATKKWLQEKNKSQKIKHAVLSLKQQGIIMAKSPINKNKKVLGTVIIVTNQSWLETTLSEFESTIELASAGALLVAAGFGLLLSRRIVRPILNMRKTAEQLAKGNYQTRVAVTGQDELASLGKQMNRLAESLSYYQSSRREFLSHVAHELRTPLTYVKGYAALLARTAKDEEEKNLTHIIFEQSNRLERIVDDLVTLSRLDEGQIKLHPEKTELGLLLNKIVEEMKPRAKELDIELNLHVKESIDIFVDIHRFHQIIMNLIDNALRYSKKGTIVTISTFKDRKHATIQVKDQGIGMTPEQLDRIWERFYRVEKSRSRQYGGSGLGLSIVKHLVELHHGTIDVHSVPEKGTTFIIKFPITKKDE
ncbi:sensor histidine kinase [Laceyella putida]|uniref:histidine kinase n=1 Tax=Laceyella putida TaxID=110101 RepID=A0ABW2RLC8_9BACL